MTDWIGSILRRCGQTVVIRRTGGDVSAQAFLQPVTEKREEFPDEMTPLGWLDGRLWLYLGELALETDDRVVWDTMTFRVRSCRPYYLGNRLTHYWAALEMAKEEAE